MEEKDLINAAKRYLKETYDEDTVSMEITNNSVVNGTGTLSVNCTVNFRGSKSNWSKKFRFEKGKVVDMSARMR